MSLGVKNKTSNLSFLPGSKGITVVSKTRESQDDACAYMKRIFGERPPIASPLESTSSDGQQSEKKHAFQDMETLEADLDRDLERILQENQGKLGNVDDADAGRLGPDKVLFDTAGNYGTMVIEADRLGVTSPVNFSTIRANTCVYSGRWCYELMLGSMGVMQVGWSTVNCKFSQENGVGDTDDSYSYDGSRVRKWNAKIPRKYGQAWQSGDIITCCIDCDAGIVTFYRNGKSLGDAYTDVHVGPGIAFFPAVSLSKAEALRANFGGTPLKFPVPGFRPIQETPQANLLQAQLLFGYLENLISCMVNHKQACSGIASAAAEARPVPAGSHQISLMLIASHIFEKLAPLLVDIYIVDVCLVDLLKRLYDPAAWSDERVNAALTTLLDLLHTFLQDFELRQCMEHLGLILISAYRYVTVDPQFSQQFAILTLILSILRHEQTRKYLMKHVIFDKVKFPVLMHIKPPDDSGLRKLFPDVWWHHPDDPDEQPRSSEEQARKTGYYSAVHGLTEAIGRLEAVQVEMLKLLLTATDNSKGTSSRFIFLHKFREFLKDNSLTPPRVAFGNLCPLPACLSFFHRLLQAVKFYWQEFSLQHPDNSVCFQDAFVPCCKFFDETINYHDLPRLGGLISHLNKTYKEEVYAAQLENAGLTGHKLAQHRALLVKHSAFVSAQRRVHQDEALGAHVASAHSLVEIADGLVLLYTIAAHTQLGKMCGLRDTITEYSKALEDAEAKIKQCPPDQEDIRAELERSCGVFRDKCTEQGRQMGWVMAAIYTKAKQGDVVWMLKASLTTVERAAAVGQLFTFMPSFYVDAVITGYNALKGYFHPTVPYTLISDLDATMYRVALFLSNHVSDGRIVYADTKEAVIQALACFVCYPMSLRVLETLDEQHQEKILRFLMAPYEDRSWAQTNWIFVRLWKGCGFGFRYQHLPNMIPMKNQQQEISHASNQAPNPSPVLQRLVGRLLREDGDLATRLIDSLLNQLNWAWSEFIEMLQGLQQIASRPVQAFIDARQFKICATCFDIAVGLLRALEMVIHLAPELLTDNARGGANAELLLLRLCQSLSQVLNRVTCQSNTFDTLVAAGLPGMETVDHFPILTALTGVIVELVTNNHHPDRRATAVAAILAEPSFDLKSLHFLLGGACEVTAGSSTATTPPPHSPPRPNNSNRFSLKNFRDVSAEEVAVVEDLLRVLESQAHQDTQSVRDLDDDAICDICYARPKGVRFHPCGHQSCKSCITHHLMSKRECFFCKATISHVHDLVTGNPVGIPSAISPEKK